MESPSQDFYNRLKPWLFSQIAKELRFAYRILDLGCGDCKLVRWLTETYGKNTIGVDTSDLEFPPDKNKVSCIRADAKSLDFIREATMDAVVSFWSLHEMDSPLAVLQEAKRVLRPLGEILIIEFPRGSLAQRLWNEAYYSIGELANMLRKTGFWRPEVRLIVHHQLTWAKAFKISQPKGIR